MQYHDMDMTSIIIVQTETDCIMNMTHGFSLHTQEISVHGASMYTMCGRPTEYTANFPVCIHTDAAI